MILRVLSNIADVIVLLPIFYILINRQYLTKELRILSIYIFLGFIRNFISIVYNFLLLKYNVEANTVFYYNLYSILGFYFISYLYVLLLDNKFWNRLIIISILFFSIFSIFDFLNGTLQIATPKFNKYSYTVSAFFITLFSLSHLYQILKELQTDNILTFSYFWVSVAFLLYFSCTIYVYLFVKQTLNDTQKDGLQYWTIDAIFSIIFNVNLTFAFAFSKYLPRK